MTRTDDIAARLQAVRNRITAAALDAGRKPESIQLLAVSKTAPAEALRAALAAGQDGFGESYLREALGKMAALEGCACAWHFIGPLQSNKTRKIAERFDWVHSVDRLKIAERLSAQRPDRLPPLNVCLEVNVSGEASKAGLRPEDVPALAAAVSRLPRLHLRGLMSIPAPSRDPARQHAAFAALRGILDALNAQGLGLDTLSMGMSDDLEAAIAEGATLVRVGTAIFGARG